MTIHSDKLRKNYNVLQARHVRQCWKESLVVAFIWLAALAFCVTVFATMGYVPPEQRPDVPNLILGIPSWVFWGLFVPWIVLIGVTWLFALFVLKDDEKFVEWPGDTGLGKGNEDAAGRD